jgi:hypothetical protein
MEPVVELSISGVPHDGNRETDLQKLQRAFSHC